eukprot:TRINITY_DN5094_c0_g1_i17.p1 TRINITY_DN5094_c0_g1~~TRINITY_DN5094_c0_g1_i17.p1  ORF type:complete len:231 (+),score=41.95 TRINITY_DN5094_c0_g1_i17:1200-1892(+)
MLLILVKFLLYENKLNKPMNGGLSSHGVSLLVINFLTRYSVLHNNTMDFPEIGVLYIKFLRFYGKKFNNTHMISVPWTPSPLSKAGTRWSKCNLVVRDPLNPNRNITKLCTAWKKIKFLFLDLEKKILMKQKDFSKNEDTLLLHLLSLPLIQQRMNVLNYNSDPNSDINHNPTPTPGPNPNSDTGTINPNPDTCPDPNSDINFNPYPTLPPIMTPNLGPTPVDSCPTSGR